MDIKAKKCDVCGTIDYGTATKNWLGYCPIGDGLFLSGPLSVVPEHVSRFTGSNSVTECCSPVCLFKAATKVDPPSLKAKKTFVSYDLHTNGI